MLIPNIIEKLWSGCLLDETDCEECLFYDGEICKLQVKKDLHWDSISQEVCDEKSKRKR